ncbi:unnamed protein product [Scytosiphon promiscuus]
MYVPLHSVFLSLALVGLVAAQADEKDGAPYPVEEMVDGLGSSTAGLAPDGYPDCIVLSPDWVGDGWCDDFGNYNTEACGYDGGDCCECDCSNATYDCGTQAPYACADPDSNCPSECNNGLTGIEGSNDAGTVCCPLGCNQCGGAGCAQSGAGQGLGSTDCCVNGVLNTHDFCNEIGETPCKVEVVVVEECIDGIEGYLGENDNGSVCCPTGCTQCGGAGCGTVGAGEDLGNTDCCINGVLNNQEFCSVTNAAPCVVDPTCSDGTVGIEGSNDSGSVCCPTECTQCGGAGCATAGAAAGLGNTDCCINGVLNNQDSCSVTGTAPCVL